MTAKHYLIRLSMAFCTITCILFLESYPVSSITIKMATLLPMGTAEEKKLKENLHDISRRTGNEVVVKLYSDNVVGDEQDVLRKMRVDRVQMSTFTGLGVGYIAPELRVIESPGLFRSIEEVEHVYAALEDFYKERFLEKGYVLLGMWDTGFLYFFSRQDFFTDDWTKGKKMMIWKGDHGQKVYMENMGLKTVPLNISDVNTALNAGMINSCFGPPLALTAFGWYTNIRYMLDYPFTSAMFCILINKSTFDRIKPSNQRICLEVFRNTLVPSRKMVRKVNAESRLIMEQAGVKIQPPGRSQIADFEAAAARTVEDAIKQGIYSRENFERVVSILEDFRAR